MGNGYGLNNENIFERSICEVLTGKYQNDSLAWRESQDKVLHVSRTQHWTYLPEVKTTEALWANLKRIVEQRNQDQLSRPLSDNEFEQIKQEICKLETPYQAGQALYGHNGNWQVEVDLDNDEGRVYLNLMKQKEIGAGSTVYQVVTQVHRDAVLPGKPSRRFDTTLLINGLPLIQIEEKAQGHNVSEALHQMKQYIHERQYSDIFSTVQVLVAMTPTDVRYMANTTAEHFNTDFAFRWQRPNCETVRNWFEFTELFLSIPMAHKMSTNYTILDGTSNRQMVKVMRPYQVYATEAVLESLREKQAETGRKKVGYVWHTTGSGKTITSFKTAWLASRQPNVEKVVFVVDRVALTRQTIDCYRAYDPEGADGLGGSTSIESTEDVNELRRKLRSASNQIIVTSIQKLHRLAVAWEKKNEPATQKRIVFIVDEAHRSTSGESLKLIYNVFGQAAWIGYTGTPMFEDVVTGDRKTTSEIFGPALHCYTIREAIADRNVLGFKVDFETTLPRDKMRSNYLPAFFRAKYPEWTDSQIQHKVDNLSDEDMDDAVESSVYDENPEHIRLVVEDVFTHWKNRSNNGLYNALFTTHVGGGKSSIPMALAYFREFHRVNAEREKQGLFTLKVGITFSQQTDNKKEQCEKNEGLHEAIRYHNKCFGTEFDLTTVAAYTQDVAERLARTARDRKFYDIVIVVDQLLTGFDAPQLNTLYVDRTLRNASLIQAYSRTNRIANMQEKPWGRIINYRWPAYNERLMREALGHYANRSAADEQDRLVDIDSDDILTPDFKDVVAKVKATLDQLDGLSNHFTEIPCSEAQREEMLALLREYSRGISQLKQFDFESVGDETIGFNYDNPDDLLLHLGITPEEQERLTVSLYNELKEAVAIDKDVPVAQIEFEMVHIKDIRVNYDYITELLETLMNQIHEKDLRQAAETHKKIGEFTLGMENRKEATGIQKVADGIFNGTITADTVNMQYPVKFANISEVVDIVLRKDLDSKVYRFRVEWGIVDVISNGDLLSLLQREKSRRNSDNAVTDIQKMAGAEYHYKATREDIRTLSRIQYRNQLREAIDSFAEQIQDEI